MNHIFHSSLRFLKCQALIFCLVFLFVPVSVNAICCSYSVSQWNMQCPVGAGGNYLFGSFPNNGQWDFEKTEGAHLWIGGDGYIKVIRDGCQGGLTQKHYWTSEVQSCSTWPAPSCVNDSCCGCAITLYLIRYGYSEANWNQGNSRWCLWWGEYGYSQPSGPPCHVLDCPAGQHFNETACAGCECDSQPQCVTQNCMIAPTIENECLCGCPEGSTLVQAPEGWYCQPDQEGCVLNPNGCQECCVTECPEGVYSNWKVFPGDCDFLEEEIEFGIDTFDEHDYQNIKWFCGNQDKSIYLELPLTEKHYSYTELLAYLKTYVDGEENVCPYLKRQQYTDCNNKEHIVDGYYVFFEADMVIPNECNGILSNCEYAYEGLIGEECVCKNYVSLESFSSLNAVWGYFPFSTVPWASGVLEQLENISSEDIEIYLPVYGSITISALNLSYIRMLFFIMILFGVVRHILKRLF